MSNPQKLPPKESTEVIYLPNESIQFQGLNESNKKNLSEIMRISFYNLIRYSQAVRENIIYNDIINTFTNHLDLFARSSNIRFENIELFFRLLQNEKIEISNDQYCDLFRLSEHFGVDCLTNILKSYFKRHIKNIDFIIQLLIDQISTQKYDIITNSEFSKEMEDCLSCKIDECVVNSNFCKLPISTIYRIIEKSDASQISSDLLYEFISKNINERFTLLLFLNLRNLSDEKFNSLHKLFESNKKTSINNFSPYLPIDLDYIKYLKDDNKIKEEHNIQLQCKIDELRSQIDEINKKFEDLQSHNHKLENRLKEVEEERDNLKAQDKALKDKIQSIIPIMNDDIINIVERDVRFSHDVRNIFTNGSDNEIVGFICKDTKFSSAIRSIFKSEKDSWINSQIEEYHNQFPKLKNQVNILENEKQDLVRLASELKTNLQRLKSDNAKLNEDYQNLQIKVQEISARNAEIKSQIEKESQGYFDNIELLIPQILNIDIINKALLAACELCKTELVKNLLSNKNIDVSSKDIYYYILFHCNILYIIEF
ncbi:hypothetical protein M9Y10_003505 [Tritrichomonas musculus]|uniref:Uncharacterized protein n=1 Tax=Tritrichomonas musculus TaxID=1915356 RepID=A0ABR2JPJ9_9EUKA